MEKSLLPIRFIYKNIYLLIIAAWLITISFVIDNYWSASSSLTTVQRKIESYIQNREQDFKQLVKDNANLQKIINQDIDEQFLESITKKDYFVFFYSVSDTSSDNLICWNTQKVLPLPFMLYNKVKNGFVKLDNGYYVWDRVDLGKLKCIELIPVKWDYFIENEYLQNNFAVDETISLNYDLADNSRNALLIKDIDGNGLFYVYEKRSAVIQHSNTFAVYLQIIAFFLIFYFIHLFSVYYSKQKNSLVGLLFLIDRKSVV